MAFPNIEEIYWFLRSDFVCELDSFSLNSFPFRDLVLFLSAIVWRFQVLTSNFLVPLFDQILFDSLLWDRSFVVFHLFGFVGFWWCVSLEL